MEQLRSVENVKVLGACINSRVITLSLLLILTGLALSTPTPCRAADLLEQYQFASNIGLASLLPSMLKVEDVKIQNVVRMSYVCVNEEDSPISMNISQGKVVWKTDNLTVQSASLIDNYGEHFTPLNFSGYIMNPQLEGTIGPHSMYNLSLIMVFMPGAQYIDSYKAWEFGTTIRSGLSTEARITLPANFSIPFYALGANYSRDGKRKVLTWHNTPQQTLNISVVFLPFLYSPETIFLNFSMDISSVFPMFAGTIGTITQEFTSLSEYNGLIVPQIFEIPVSFPLSGNGTRVVSVYDGDGPCKPIPDRLSEINYTNCGKYYPDNKDQEVFVYPRAGVSENEYYYTVSVTFNFGNSSSSNMSFRFLMPYEYAYGSAVNLTTSGDWKINLAQNTIVEFWLPQEAVPYQKPNDYNIYYDIGSSRYYVIFVNTSSEWTMGKWAVYFYIPRLYNFFWIQVISIISLFGLIIVVAGLRKYNFRSAAGKMISWARLGPSLIAAEYAVAGGWFFNIITQKAIFLILLFIQAGLTAAIFLLAEKWKFGEQTRGEASQP